MMMNISVQIIEDRLRQIIKLDSGGHRSFDEGVCALEAASYIVGEPWSDHPKCVCPVIAAFMRSWNDALSDDKRNEYLLPLIPRIIGTKATKDTEERRSLMAADWLVRVHTPAWLRLAGLITQADALASLPEITSMAQVPSIREPIEAARRDANAAWFATRAAAGAAAWAAARAAAGAAAGDTAGEAARAAAWDAAGDTAGEATRAAAGAKLKPTMDKLQSSAAALLHRMVDIEDGRAALSSKEAQ